MADSTLSTKGQITIPKAVRDALHLEVGEKVFFDIQDDGSVVLMARNQPVESLFGMLKTKARLKRPLSIEEMNPASADDA
jgi:AbrB family looped-hinge helix DNA binding protein